MSLILLSTYSIFWLDESRGSFLATFTISTFLPEHSFMLKSYGWGGGWWWPMWLLCQPKSFCSWPWDFGLWDFGLGLDNRVWHRHYTRLCMSAIPWPPIRRRIQNWELNINKSDHHFVFWFWVVTLPWPAPDLHLTWTWTWALQKHVDREFCQRRVGQCQAAKDL